MLPQTRSWSAEPAASLCRPGRSSGRFLQLGGSGVRGAPSGQSPRPGHGDCESGSCTFCLYSGQAFKITFVKFYL